MPKWELIRYIGSDNMRPEEDVLPRAESPRDQSALLRKLDVPSLLRLRKYFVESTIADDRRPNAKRGTLDIDEGHFVNAICTAFGSMYNLDAVKLHRRLSGDGAGRVSWEGLLDAALADGSRALTRAGALAGAGAGVAIEEPAHCKKESIAIIVTIESSTSFCYVIISQHGKVGVYDGKLKLLLNYDLFFIRTGINKRVRDVWITGCIFLSDSKCLVITASDKSMMIYDASTLCHVPLYLITGITNVITCLSYNASTSSKNKSHLVIGDDLGGLTTITFKRPRLSLFYKKYQDKLNLYFWIELQGPLNENYCKISFKRRIHSRPIKKIHHIISNDSIISCSNDPERSVVIQHNKGIRDPYVFKISRGVTCFYYSDSLSLLATGGGDGYLRLWEPVVTAKPSATLSCQSTRIVDVVILAHLCIVLSLNKHAVLQVWEIFDHTCIQIINLRFPSFDVLGKPIQFGLKSIYCGALRKHKLNDKETNETNVPNRTNDNTGVSDTDIGKMKCNNKEFLKWNRPEIIVTCCNHIAVIPFSMLNNEKETKDANCYLPPPERTHRPRKPSIWEDEQQKKDLAVSNNHSNESSGPLVEYAKADDNLLKNILSYPPLEEMMNEIGLSGIMDTDFLEKMGLKHDINKKIGLQKIKQEKMRLPVSQGAPFTALDLHDHKEIKFSLSLPISERMKIKSGLDFFSDPRDILIHKSCFSMETPKSNYGTSTTNKISNNKHKNNEKSSV